MTLEDIPVDHDIGGPPWAAIVAAKADALDTSAELRAETRRRQNRDAQRRHRAANPNTQPRRRRRKGEEPPHGTLARYQWVEDPCRCDPCRAANTERSRLERVARRARTKASATPVAKARRPTTPTCPHDTTVRYPHPIGPVCLTCGGPVLEVAS